MSTNRKRSVYVALGILIVSLIMWAIFRGSPTSVETAVAERGPMRVTVDAQGKTRVRDKFTVTAPVSGIMARIKLTEGDNIPRDYPVAEIDPNPPIQRAPAAPRSFNPYAARVFSPVSGKVLRVFDKSERFVTAGTPILEIGDPENVEVVVDILSTEAVNIRPGAPMSIENERQGEPIRARVTLIESQAVTKVSALGVEEERVNVIGEFLSRKVPFGDNFHVDVSILVWESADALRVPSSAVFRTGEEWSVFVVEGGKARKRTVKVGHRNPDLAEILEGLSGSETVILHPTEQLADGSRVRTS